MANAELLYEKIAVDEGLQGLFETEAETSGEIAQELKNEIESVQSQLSVLKGAYKVYHGLDKLGLETKEQVGKAMYECAMEDKKGDNVLSMLEEASKLGCVEATLEFGKALVYGKYGASRQVEEGLRIIFEEANNDNPEACYLLVKIHKKYPDVVGPDTAFAMCQKAASHGLPAAIKRLKEPFEMTKETLDLQARLAKGEKGVAYLLFQRGDLTLDDREKYFNIALEEGDAVAEYDMGKILRDAGKEEEAKAYFERSVEHGNSLACFALARIVLHGKPHFYHGGGIPDRNDPDYQEEFRLMSIAAELGDYRGLCVMGRSYVRGYMVDKDYEKAREYLQKAYDLGERFSSPRLLAETYRYTDAPGTAEKAVELYQIAANSGNRSAMLGLMDIYEEGLREVKQDLGKADYYRYLAGDHF